MRDRVPRGNLLQDAAFDAGRLGVQLDMVIACSLFTHLPARAIRQCFENLAPAVRPAGVFFASYFACPEGAPPPVAWLQARGGVVTHDDRDPLHYRFTDLAACADGLPWRSAEIGAWGHPRGQRMARFERLLSPHWSPTRGRTVQVAALADLAATPAWSALAYVADRTLPEALHGPQGVAADGPLPTTYQSHGVSVIRT